MVPSHEIACTCHPGSSTIEGGGRHADAAIWGPQVVASVHTGLATHHAWLDVSPAYSALCRALVKM